MKRTIGFLLMCLLANGGALAGDDRDAAERIAKWRHMAQYGAKHGVHAVSFAQYKLGQAHLNGYGVARDEGEAVWWLRTSAQRGYAPAQFLLARLYLEGRGVQQDVDDAIFWYRTAAAQGHGHAQARLSYLYANGIGVRKSSDRADYWAQKAGESGVLPTGLAAADVASGPAGR